MYEEFTQNRIAQLRMQKNVSARDMSLTLGQNNSYINQIENKKALPSLQGLFYICEYFGITPQQFFDDGSAYPAQLADLVEDMKKLDAASLEHIAAIVKEMVGNKESHVRCKKTGTKRRAAALRLVPIFCAHLWTKCPEVKIAGERRRAAPRQVRAAQWRRAFPEDRTGAATAFHSPAATP